MFETIIATFVMVSIGTVIGNIAYLDSMSQTSGFAYQNMAYDFVQIAYGDTSYRGCIAEWNATCIDSLLSNMSKAYGADYLRVQFGGNSTSYGSGSLPSCKDFVMQCYPFPTRGGYSQLCIYACGG
jgi:hypothetical protein